MMLKVLVTLLMVVSASSALACGVEDAAAVASSEDAMEVSEEDMAMLDSLQAAMENEQKRDNGRQTYVIAAPEPTCTMM